jgi:hypothetical protein
LARARFLHFPVGALVAYLSSTKNRDRFERASNFRAHETGKQ